MLEWVAFPSPGDLINPGVKPRSPTLQADYLPTEPPGKPNNTGVGSLSLLQQISLTQESNWRLLHGRQILHQLSYQGRPYINLTLSTPLSTIIFASTGNRSTGLSTKTKWNPNIFLWIESHIFPFQKAASNKININ